MWREVRNSPLIGHYSTSVVGVGMAFLADFVRAGSRLVKQYFMFETELHDDSASKSMNLPGPSTWTRI